MKAFHLNVTLKPQLKFAANSSISLYQKIAEPIDFLKRRIDATISHYMVDED
jgi:hypothetical protein